MKFRTGISLTSAATILLLTAPVQAQRSSPGLILEEVIVTATKREENLQDVPVAVTALSADSIKEAQIHSSAQLTQLVPSLTLQRGSDSRESSFNIRGVGTQSFSIGTEPSVSTMLDGVVMGRSGQAFMELMDIQRVEVLRGPQGTLFGKNSTAGVVHIITKQPSDEHSGEIMAMAQSDEEYRAGFTVSGPLTSDLGYRLTASGNDLDDYTKNFYDGEDYNGYHNWTARGKLRWAPTDDLDFTLSADYGDQECKCTVAPIGYLEPWDGNEEEVQDILDLISPVVPSDDNTEVNINNVPKSESDQWGTSLEANWALGDYTLTSITAARAYDIDGNSNDDYDGQPITVIGLSQTGDTSQDQFTQELRITSPDEGPVTYVAGLYYFDQSVDRKFERSLSSGTGALISSGVASFTADTTNWAAFGEAIWAFSDAWRLVFGGRYTNDDVSFDYRRSRDGLPIGIPDPVDPSSGSTDEDDFSGKLALQWDFNADSMAYLTYAQGYKGPAFDLTFESDPETQDRVDPETSDSWELGMKSTWFDGRAMLNAAVFYSKYDDFQAEGFFDSDGLPNCPPDNLTCDPDDDPGAFILINAGKVTTQGVELDFQAALTENLRITGGLSYIDTKIDEYPNGPCSNGQTYREECDLSQDLSGGELPYTPEWKGNLTASYFWTRDSLFDVVFIGAMHGQDEVQYSLAQDKYAIGDAYTIFDASVVFKDHSERWEATLFVKNLTDEFYVANIRSMNGVFIPNAYQHTYSNAAERRYGLEMRYRW
ncbi:MAG: TonB-dependent receptor [Halioglobus sp.]|nr:TonB-dependent receptor [Halioglobus sp.]|tara:strand:+ start:2030 stop:4330 length:2301 start_codon:yes stop_codon:yes gene_type:complete